MPQSKQIFNWLATIRISAVLCVSNLVLKSDKNLIAD